MCAKDYQLIERAIVFLERHAQEQPALSAVAAQAGLSEFHFQRLFQRWAGVSPKRFLQFYTAQEAKRALRASGDLLDASYRAGLSGPGRLHDLLISLEAMTPGEYKQRGAGLEIAWGVHPSPFGECLIGVTERGICALEFLQPLEAETARARLQAQWERAVLVHAPQRTGTVVEQLFDARRNWKAPLALVLKGTNFQIKVWEALLRVPSGALTTYGGLAQRLGRPQAARAVGGAVAANPIAYLIPCHRVIRASGVFGDYRWGMPRKRILIARELAQAA